MQAMDLEENAFKYLIMFKFWGLFFGGGGGGASIASLVNFASNAHAPWKKIQSQWDTQSVFEDRSFIVIYGLNICRKYNDVCTVV